MTPRTIQKQLTPFEQAIDKAKHQTCAEITEYMAATSCSKSQALSDILALHQAASFPELWKRMAAEMMKAEEKAA